MKQERASSHLLLLKTFSPILKLFNDKYCNLKLLSGKLVLQIFFFYLSSKFMLNNLVDKKKY